MSAWIDALAVGALKAVLAPLRLMPFAAAGRLVGGMGRWLLPRVGAARRMRTNLAHIWPELPEDEVAAICAGVGDNFARLGLEYTHMDRFAPAARFRVEGMAHLRDALAAGKGALVVSAHLSNWEAIRLGARDQGVEIGMIRQGFKNAAFDVFAQPRQEAAGRPVLARSSRGQAEMLRHLRAGGAIMILLDQRVGRGAALPFLGRPAHTSLAVAALARRTGAALVPARARREADGLSFTVRFEPQIAPGEDDAATMQAVNDRFSAWIRETPEQWFWLHRRWKWAERALDRQSGARE